MTIQGKTINTGEILHALQILLLVGMVGMFYQQFQDIKASGAVLSEQFKRIDHYLASKDPNYYRETNQ